MSISRTKFSVNFSSLEYWDVGSTFLTLTNKCDWNTIRLIDIVKIRSEEASAEEISERRVLLLDRISFDEGKIHAGKKNKTRMKQYKAYEGDIVVSKINARKRAIGIAENSTPVCSTIHFRTLIPNPGVVDTKFLWLALRSSYCKNQFEILTGGQGKGEISEEKLLQIEVPFPPLSTQQKIITYWENVNADIKAAIALSQELTNNTSDLLVSEIGLPNLGRAHSKRAFISTWREIERWGVNIAREMTRKPDLKVSPFPIVSLSDVIEDLQNGWSPKCHTRPAKSEEWGVLKVGAVSFGWFDQNQNKALPKNLVPMKQYEVVSGDLIISRANITQYVGACALVNQVRSKLMLCDKLFRVVWMQNSSVLPEYLNEILKIPHLRWQIENKLTGASPTMKNISKPALLSLKFPLPPLEIQKKIMDVIKARRDESRILLAGAQKMQEEVSKQVEKLILGTLSVEDI